MDNIQVGDLVTIRSWDDMADEFGTIASGLDIRIKPDGGILFNISMRKYCGGTYEVAFRGFNSRGHLRFKLRGDGVENWVWSSSMFEREEESEIQVDESDFMAILNA